MTYLTSSCIDVFMLGVHGSLDVLRPNQRYAGSFAGYESVGKLM